LLKFDFLSITILSNIGNNDIYIIEGNILFKKKLFLMFNIYNLSKYYNIFHIFSQFYLFSKTE